MECVDIECHACACNVELVNDTIIIIPIFLCSIYHFINMYFLKIKINKSKFIAFIFICNNVRLLCHQMRAVLRSIAENWHKAQTLFIRTTLDAHNKRQQRKRKQKYEQHLIDN